MAVMALTGVLSDFTNWIPIDKRPNSAKLEKIQKGKAIQFKLKPWIKFYYFYNYLGWFLIREGFSALLRWDFSM